MRLQGEVAVVTGASSGIGRAVARELASRGCAVAMVARSREGLEAAARDVSELGGRAAIMTADISDPSTAEELASLAERELGPISVWINNAMVTVLSPATCMEPSEYRRVTEVNYLGTVYGTLIALKRMESRNRGVIVQVGSALAYRSIPLQSAYCASKAAIRGFTDSVRCELMHERRRIRISMVQLPAVNTPQFLVARNRLPRRPRPVAPVFTPEVAARAIAYAAEHGPREVTAGGSALLAVAAQRLAPWLADRYLARTGYESQQTDQLEPPGRPDNLFEPLEGDRGAAGPFRDEAHGLSLQLWLRTRLAPLAVRR